MHPAAGGEDAVDVSEDVEGGERDVLASTPKDLPVIADRLPVVGRLDSSSRHHRRTAPGAPLVARFCDQAMLFKTQAIDYYMHWLPQVCCYLFIYKTPMHRKRVRLKSKLFNILWCVPYALMYYSV